MKTRTLLVFVLVVAVSGWLWADVIDVAPGSPWVGTATGDELVDPALGTLHPDGAHIPLPTATVQL